MTEIPLLDTDLRTFTSPDCQTALKIAPLSASKIGSDAILVVMGPIRRR